MISQNDHKNDKVQDIVIFLDIDGVVADFDHHATTQGKRKSDGKLDYDALDFQWWSTIPAFDGASDFYEDLQELAKVKFLTGPMVTPDCHHGKAVWVQSFSSKGKWALLDLIICPSKDKEYLAGEGRILVDDRISNVEAWQNAGGKAVHHTGDFEKTLKEVKRLMYLEQARQNLKPRSPR